MILQIDLSLHKTHVSTQEQVHAQTDTLSVQHTATEG